MTIILSSQPFYDQYVQCSTADDPISRKLYENGKLWPFFQGCLGAIDGSHIHISPLLLSKISIGIEKGSFYRIVSSYAISTCSSYTLFQAGKVPQQMLGFGLMHWQRIFCAGSILLSCRCQISSLQGTSCSFSWYSVSSSGVGCCRCLVCTFFF